MGRSQNDHIQLKQNQTIQSKRLSRYEKWFQNQAEEKQNEVRARKRQREKDRYASREHGHSKRQKAREQYADPKKGEVKRHQARDQYADPKKGEVKRQQAWKNSKVSYEDPSVRACKIQKVQSHTLNSKSDIDTVIASFQKSCKVDLQLQYTCKICERIFFKKQVKRLYRDNYSYDILRKSVASCVSVDDFLRGPKTNKDNDDQNNQVQELWICHTCDRSLKSNSISRFATVNKLGLCKQPPELSQLNMLERHLVAPAIAFMKMIPLIN